MGFNDTEVTRTNVSVRDTEYSQFASLFEIDTSDQFSQAISQIANDYGYERYIYKLVPNKQSSIDNAFVVTNCPSEWLEIYEDNKYCKIDPVVEHCYSSHIPLFWDQHTYCTDEQKELYLQGKIYGLCTGLVFPIHGPKGEFGVMCFATKKESSSQLKTEVLQTIPLLSVFVGYVFELSKNLTKNVSSTQIVITPREKEVINWWVEGKTSWEISKILSCSESTVNFHLSNVRQKFNASSTQLALIRALRCGLIQI